MPGGVGAAFDDDDLTQCSEHPLKSTSPGGGICAFCLQDKLGKLVSSSSSSFLIRSSSSSTPFFRSDLPSSSSSSATTTTSLSNLNLRNHHVNGTPLPAPTRIPFLLTHKKKLNSSLVAASSSQTLAVLNRSKSTTAPRPRYQDLSTCTPRRHKGFWSFLHLPSSHHKKIDKLPSFTSTNPQASTSTAAVVVVDEADDSPNNSATSSFGRKVSRSRSVGCGSRSFSGDLLERISTGFGDCTLRRVESQREGTQKHRHSTSAAMRGKGGCGGLLGGLMMMSSSSSYSGYWVGGESNGPRPGGRSRSWGLSLASPMRAFGGGGKTSNSMIKDEKRDEISNCNGNNNNNTPEIPSLLAVTG